MTDATRVVVALEPDETRAVAERAMQLAGEAADSWADLVELALGSEVLPERVLDATRKMAGSPRPLLVQGLPTWTGLPTPTSRATSQLTPQAADVVALAASSAIGLPVGFESVQGGRLVQDVVAFSEEPVGRPSQADGLEFHVEGGFTRHKADYIGLYCIHNTQRCATLLAPVIPDRLPDWAITALTAVRPSRINYHDADPSALWPLVRGTMVEVEASDFRVNYDETFFGFDLDATQESAMQRLRDALAAATVPVVLTPGEMVLWDNHRVVHGRDPYPLAHDGRDRWLKRIFVRRELDSVDDLLVDRDLRTFAG